MTSLVISYIGWVSIAMFWAWFAREHWGWKIATLVPGAVTIGFLCTLLWA